MSDPANLPEAIPELEPGDAISASHLSETDLTQAVVTASANPGMGELIQLAAHLSAPHFLSQTTGKGAGNVFGSGSGFAGGGKAASLKRTPPARSAESMKWVEDGTMVEGWMFIGLDQDEKPVFVHPQDTVVWYDDDPRQTNLAPKKQLWIKRFRAAGFHVEPWPFRVTYDGNRAPIGFRNNADHPFYAGNFLSAIARMRKLNRSTVLAWGPFLYTSAEEYPPHFRQWLAEVEAMRANGERFIIRYTSLVPSYAYQKVLDDNGQSSVRMDAFSYFRHRSECPDSGTASGTQSLFKGRNHQEVHDRIRAWLMTSNETAAHVDKALFEKGKSYVFDQAFRDLIRGQGHGPGGGAANANREGKQ